MILSKIEWLKDNRHVDLYGDGEFILRVHTDVLTKFGLKTGDQLSEEVLETLKSSAEFALAKEKAIEILNRRVKSVKELRSTLRNKEFKPKIIDRVIAHLNEMGILDDRKFAELYTHHILERKASGKIYLQSLLRRKGINNYTINDVLEDVLPGDKEEEQALSAARAALERLQSSGKTADDKKVQQKLVLSLSRRGFSFSMIQKALRTISSSVNFTSNGEENNP